MNLERRLMPAFFCSLGGQQKICARRPTGDELNRLLGCLSRRILRVLERRVLLIADPEYPSLDWVPWGIATKRLSVDGRGRVVYCCKQPFRDGSTHVLLEPLDFMGS